MNVIENNNCECGLPETTSHFFSNAHCILFLGVFYGISFCVKIMNLSWDIDSCVRFYTFYNHGSAISHVF